MKHLRVEEFAKVITGGTPSTRISSYWDGEIPWLNSGDLNQGIIHASSKLITKAGLKNSAARMMPMDSVLIALTGATTGVTALLKIVACANQSVTGILPSSSHIPKYLYYYLSSIRSKVIDQSYGGAQKHISQGFVKKIV
ncbi:MAG: restriction endonuclease subunit S, partial [Planctomycetes bacterium]|nr:restriction endonuclease subunit S [Planctomycetota bacterium]